MPSMPRIFPTSIVCLFSSIVLLMLPLGGCSGARELKIAGRTMGTSYHVTIIVNPLQTAADLQPLIEKRLAELNQSMSTFQPESEISRFNALQAAGRAFAVSPDFYTVAKLGQRLYAITDGAWDGTIDPLVDLWGFGRSPRRETPPPESAIKERLTRVGFDQIDLDQPGNLIKRRSTVTLDLASVAKGYGVDALAQLIREQGYTDYLVEIGGEVYAAGHRIDGTAWRVGINQPEATAAPDQIYQVVRLTNRAFATSGDYRNYFEFGGRRYAHIIDPRTGFPAARHLVSVSVLADTCALADGLATALMVMGPQAGLALIDRLEGIDCLMVERAPDGRLIDHRSQGFPPRDNAAS